MTFHKELGGIKHEGKKAEPNYGYKTGNSGNASQIQKNIGRKEIGMPMVEEQHPKDTVY